MFVFSRAALRLFLGGWNDGVTGSRGAGIRHRLHLKTGQEWWIDLLSIDDDRETTCRETAWLSSN